MIEYSLCVYSNGIPGCLLMDSETVTSLPVMCSSGCQILQTNPGKSLPDQHEWRLLAKVGAAYEQCAVSIGRA
jgi:hypothetical protein